MKAISNKKKKHLKLKRKLRIINLVKFYQEPIEPIFAPDFFSSWRDVANKMEHTNE